MAEGRAVSPGEIGRRGRRAWRVGVIAVMLSLVGAGGVARGDPAVSAYSAAVLASHPAGFWEFDDVPSSRLARDVVGEANGTYHFHSASIPGVVGRARDFNGSTSYVTIPNRLAWSKSSRGVLTVEFWMRPDALVFTHEEGSGYVWVVAKGQTDAQEWGFRMYGTDNTESPPRANRIAFYAYNPIGGEGAGAYSQSPVTVGKWIYIVGELTQEGVRIYRDGRLTQGPPAPATLYADPAYHVTLRHGSAPLRVGTRNFGSYFAGAVDELAIYPRLLSQSEIVHHYRLGIASLAAAG